MDKNGFLLDVVNIILICVYVRLTDLKMMVWGKISSDHCKQLVILEGSWTALRYRYEVMMLVIILFFKAIIKPPDVTQHAWTWIFYTSFTRLVSIEHVYAQKSTTYVISSCVIWLLQECNHIIQANIQTFILSMPRWCVTTSNANGDRTRYWMCLWLYNIILPNIRRCIDIYMAIYAI